MHVLQNKLQHLEHVFYVCVSKEHFILYPLHYGNIYKQYQPWAIYGVADFNVPVLFFLFFFHQFSMVLNFFFFLYIALTNVKYILNHAFKKLSN